MSNFCKYYKQQKQVSYDSGQTWSNVVPAEYQIGDFYGESIDCQDQSIITRWVLVPGAFLCVKGDKYEKEIAEYSVDGGYTFVSYYPAVYRTGNKLESNAEICHNKWEGYYYQTGTTCPPGYRWVEGRGCVIAYNGSVGIEGRYGVDPVKYIRCSASTSTILTEEEVKYSPYILYEGYIGDCVTSIGRWAFRECDSLTTIEIPSGVTSIGKEAFWYCTGLSSITISNGVTSIDMYAFEGCSSLTGVTIPDSVTSIGYMAFEYCSSLRSVTIGSGITAINGYAFADCSGLTSITIYATIPPELQTHEFFNTNNCPIYVPSASVNAYKTAADWEDYASRIQAIP